MSNIVDMIKSAVEKDASGFESSFDTAMASKMDSALQAHYDSTYCLPAEVDAIDDATPVETELETEE
jgi:hypothetical protein